MNGFLDESFQVVNRRGDLSAGFLVKFPVLTLARRTTVIDNSTSATMVQAQIAAIVVMAFDSRSAHWMLTAHSEGAAHSAVELTSTFCLHTKLRMWKSCNWYVMVSKERKKESTFRPLHNPLVHHTHNIELP